MNLLEAEGKRLFTDFGIPVPKGIVSDGEAPVGVVSFPAVVKAQVPTGGRGKAGGIRIAENERELDAAVRDIIGMKIKEYMVDQVLVEQRIKSQAEFYVSIAVDRSKRGPVVIASAKGGMDIENVPDDEIHREWIDPWVGLQPFIAKSLAFAIGLRPELMGQFQYILQNLWKLSQGMDAELVEINPLAVTPDMKMVAVDSKVVIDDDSLFRHEEFKRFAGDITPLERKARDEGIAFVQLDGDIGVIANGAGLTMATLDFLSVHGGKGGVFLDLGGTDNPVKVKEALQLMAEAEPKVILINIFGGITKCDTVASGLLQALEGGGIEMPIVARIKGVNEGEALEMLRKSRIQAALSLDEATKTAVKIAAGR